MNTTRNYEYLKKYIEKSRLGDNSPIRILIDTKTIEDIEQKRKSIVPISLDKDSYSAIGIVFEDEYIVVVRDVVRFPDGDIGTYIRLYEKPLNTDAVAILVHCGNKFVLLRHFRHATNSWHYEIPRGRGCKKVNEETAIQEVFEELGAKAEDVYSLGYIFSNSGILGSRVELFHCTVNRPLTIDKHEGIESICLVTDSKLKEMIRNNEIDDAITLAAYSLWFTQNEEHC